MYYFSDEFLKGLNTKSDDFQKEFFSIIDGVCAYFDMEDEKREFQQYIEANHSFSAPGNMLYSSKKYIGGRPSGKEITENIHHYLLWLFDSFESADAMNEAPHIIVCVSAPKDMILTEDMAFIETLIRFERVCRGSGGVSVTTILNDNNKQRTTSCFVACIK